MGMHSGIFCKNLGAFSTSHQGNSFEKTLPQPLLSQWTSENRGDPDLSDTRTIEIFEKRVSWKIIFKFKVQSQAENDWPLGK